MTRRGGDLVAVTPDGRRVRGPADVAFRTGTGGTCAPGGDGRPGATPLLLLPGGGGPDLPETLGVGGERMDLRYVVGVLLGNRDLERRPRGEDHDRPATVA